MREWRGLTLTQPWAAEVALGFKRWETRSWGTRYRGWVAIHAAKGFPRSAREFAAEEVALGRVPRTLALGAVVAVARLADVRHTAEVGPWVSGLERRLGDFGVGRWAWRLEDVVSCPPLAARGALGLWRPSEELALALEATAVGAGL